MLDISLFRTGKVASAALAIVLFAFSGCIVLYGAMLDHVLID